MMMRFQLRCSYLAISIAPADQGLVKITEGFGAAGVPMLREAGAWGSFKSVGERYGEENERR